MRAALIYAYKTRNAEEFGIDPNSVRLGYQVDQDIAPFQCDFSKDLTAYLLTLFKKEGGSVRVINSEEELVLPLADEKIQVPVPEKLLKDWKLTDLL